MHMLHTNLARFCPRDVHNAIVTSRSHIEMAGRAGSRHRGLFYTLCYKGIRVDKGTSL